MPSAESYKLYLDVRHHRTDSFEDVPSKDGEHKMYVIDSDNHEEVIPTLPALHNSVCYFPRFTASVCDDESTIYVLGGFHLGALNVANGLSRDVWYMDTDTDNGWTKGHRMKVARSHPSAVALDRKIYVFGGRSRCDDNPWAEVFDMQTGKWSPFETSSVIEGSGSKLSCVALDLNGDVDGCTVKKKMLLFYLQSEKILYSYDLALEEWDMFDNGFGSWPNPIVLSGTTLFTMMQTFLYGYDVERKQWFKEPVSGLKASQGLPNPDDFLYLPNIHLVSVGNGRLCALWAKPLGFPNPLSVYCTEFSVEKDESTLVATAMSTRVFFISDGLALVHCLALFPHRERKKGGRGGGEGQGEEVVVASPSSPSSPSSLLAIEFEERKVVNKLNAPISEWEVKQDVDNMGWLKALGQMRCKPFSIKKNWDLVASKVCELVRQAFDIGLLEGLNTTFIVLIPKEKSPEKVAELRPIRLYNMNYKVIF